MSCTPLPRASKLVSANQLTLLPCLIACIKYQFVIVKVLGRMGTGSTLYGVPFKANVKAGRKNALESTINRITIGQPAFATTAGMKVQKLWTVCLWENGEYVTLSDDWYLPCG